jgi:uncharacterized membrane protein
MHLIPASWSHFHLLVSVFPSVGLIFAIGFFVTAMVTRNAVMQRLGLFVFGGLAVLGIPTEISGAGAMAAMANRPGIPPEAADVHAFWAWAALGALAITGVTAWLVLWRQYKLERPTEGFLHLVLGLALFTLLNMIIVGEMGWEIAHQELKIVYHYGTTSQAWSHIHIILNHFPTVGYVFTLFFFVLGLAFNNSVMKRAALAAFVICGILGATTYVTGASAMWALTDPTPFGAVTQARINAHRDWALMSLFGLGITGVLAYIQVWRYRSLAAFNKTMLYVILVLAVITLGLMAETGHRGGQINHPEIRIPGEAFNSNAASYWSPQIELLINNIIYFVPWQTVHFFGYTLVFATVLAVSLRILGFWKSMPFSAVHRILPLGAFGVFMNVFTGMLMLMADTNRYVNESAFWPKMFFLPIGVVAVLYFSLSDRLWATKAGEDAPMGAKWVAVLVLFSWTVVIMGGRLLPYLFV